MAKKRRLKKTQERLTRAQPRESITSNRRLLKNKSFLRPAIVGKAMRPLVLMRILGAKSRIKGKIKLAILRNIPKETIKIPSCQAKKANARHEYFSMRSSGKGASRTNPRTDRFNSRC